MNTEDAWTPWRRSGVRFVENERQKLIVIQLYSCTPDTYSYLFFVQLYIYSNQSTAEPPHTRLLFTAATAELIKKSIAAVLRDAACIFERESVS